MKRTNTTRTSQRTPRSNPAPNQRSTGGTAPQGSNNGGLFILIAILVIAIGVTALSGPLRSLMEPSTPAIENQSLETPGEPGDTPADPAPSTTTTTTTETTVDEKPVLIVLGEEPKPQESPTGQTQTTSQQTETQVPADTSSTRPTNLFWVRVNDEGIIVLERTTRSIRLGESPLTTVLRTILAGPDTNEINQGLLSLVPARTRLLSVYIQEGTAFLSFSDDFQFNPMGAEGAKASLRQIVYTATEFPSVKNVQILIEGKKQVLLGGDGIPIGQPLSRSSF